MLVSCENKSISQTFLFYRDTIAVFDTLLIKYVLLCVISQRANKFDRFIIPS